MAAAATSPFFHVPPVAGEGELAILHLKRDALTPVTLKSSADDGYAEGMVTNTRFGSFPHSTLIGLEWGSQVRASRVDTGSRGRKGKKGKQQDVGAETEGNADAHNGVAGKKRKPDEHEDNAVQSPSKKAKQQISLTEEAPLAVKTPIEAGSGFIHILPPTPESWTSSLDHRTQVVYTPDYSYVLQRLRVKPGSRIIEAGAGSGSFTHAAARAVFSGYGASNDPPRKRRKLGSVFSYEYHEPRANSLRAELTDHGLGGVVHLTHRDVCNDGFLLDNDGSPNANAIFLDLPAPWVALRHLTRSSPSALDPDEPVQLCTFSPCIEQVQATVSHLRKNGWTEVEMVEIQNRRLDVRREQVGLKNEGLRGVNSSPANVAEALSRLREVELKLGEFHAAKNEMDAAKAAGTANGDAGKAGQGPWRKVQSKAERLEKIKKEAEDRKLYKEGNLVHRTESEVKTHTSYLVFAVLPREWNEEDEAAAAEMWPVEEVMRGVKEGTETQKKGSKA